MLVNRHAKLDIDEHDPETSSLRQILATAGRKHNLLDDAIRGLYWADGQGGVSIRHCENHIHTVPSGRSERVV